MPLYRVFPFQLVIELLMPNCVLPEAYWSADIQTCALQETLAAGFHWVRTDGDNAIFERDFVEAIPHEL